MEFRYIGRFEEVNVVVDGHLDITVKHGETFEVPDDLVNLFHDQPENYEAI